MAPVGCGVLCAAEAERPAMSVTVNVAMSAAIAAGSVRRGRWSAADAGAAE